MDLVFLSQVHSATKVNRQNLLGVRALWQLKIIVLMRTLTLKYRAALTIEGSGSSTQKTISPQFFNIFAQIWLSSYNIVYFTQFGIFANAAQSIVLMLWINYNGFTTPPKLAERTGNLPNLMLGGYKPDLQDSLKEKRILSIWSTALVKNFHPKKTIHVHANYQKL